jgi:hypothetical protein
MEPSSIFITWSLNLNGSMPLVKGFVINIPTTNAMSNLVQTYFSTTGAYEMFFISFLSRSFFRALVQIEPITLHNESYIWWTIIHSKFLKNFIDKGFLRTKNAFKSVFIDLNTNDIRCLTHILYVKSFREITFDEQSFIQNFSKTLLIKVSWEPKTLLNLSL